MSDRQEAVTELASNRHDRALAPAANLDPVVEAAHLRVFRDQDPIEEMGSVVAYELIALFDFDNARSHD